MENQILREKLGQKRIILNDNQKRRLAAAAMKLGRDLLRQFGTLFSPDTILRWNRMLIASKYDESWIRGAKRECFDKIVFFGEKHVRYVVEQYVEHFLTERPHKGLEYRRPVEPDVPPPLDGPVKCHERLGGLLKSYYRDVA